jgi:hypothetical protein
MNKLYTLTFLLASLLAFNVYSQTPGLIYKSAGAGASILDPNGDGYTSASTAGFTTNDQTQSEIPSSLSRYTNSNNEVMLRYELPRKNNKIITPRYF